MTYVVLGATGNTGSVVADTLLAAKQPVRVVVRSADKGTAWKHKGAEVAVADIEDRAALARAFAGAKGVYVLSPPDVRSNQFVKEAGARIASIVGAVADAKVGHVVLLSSVGAQLPSGTGPIITVHNFEKALDALGVGRTFVRAAYFLENYGGVIPVAKSDGVLPTFFPADAPIPTVATGDIGRVAAEALLAGPKGRRVIELTGPEPVSASQVAAVVGKALGKPVKAVEAPLAAVVPTFTGMGMSQNMAELYHEMIGGFLTGKVHNEGAPAAEQVRGTISAEEGLKPLLG